MYIHIYVHIYNIYCKLQSKFCSPPLVGHILVQNSWRAHDGQHSQSPNNMHSLIQSKSYFPGVLAHSQKKKKKRCFFKNSHYLV